jgi:peptide/nickel transport system substrate-binding protein
MSRNRLTLVVGLLVAFSMMLASCAPATTTPAATVPAGPTAVPTAAPTAVPARHGGWLDEVDFSIVEATSVITQISAGAVDMFSYGLAADKLADIKAANLCYTQSYGTYYDFMFNPAVFNDTTKLNPFSNRKIREAMNWAVDRNFINQEIYKGGALPKFTALTTQLVDYTGVIDVARGVEAYYAYDMTKAQAVVDAEMPAMGATKGADGKWQFNGKPITLIFLIRNDGDGTRLPQGEYFAQQLEKLGFTVDRVEKKSSELSPLWNQSDPKDGLWYLYTAGWGSSGLNRDEKSSFVQMYLPESASAKVFKSNTNFDPAFSKLANDLNNGNFTTLQQRHDMMAAVLPLSLQDSIQVFTVDLQTYAPFKCDLSVTADVGAGVETTKMGLFNLRYKDQVGGQVKSATTSTLFSEPWNPVNGSNWVTSAYIENGTSSGGLMPDPYTGLAWPLRAEKADLVVQTGLPVVTNLNWVNLTTADKIEVPGTAWVDWDAKTQKFITAAEKSASAPITAKYKSVIYYPADMFKTVKWHDGSKLSVADFVMAMIMTFDYGKADSAIYDEDWAPNVEAFLSSFKGVEIVSTDPLVIATYSDNLLSDAELDIFSWWPGSPATYGFGEASWEAIAVGNMAVANKELAWGSGQADRNKVEWISFIGGPSLDVLSKDLDKAIADKTIPYAPTMGAYLTADEAVARYTALKAWYTAHKHFWDGTGPYFVDSVDLNAGSAVIKNNPDYVDAADRWSKFGVAPLAVAALDGPAQVNIGKEAVFDLTLTKKADGSAYASADVKEVKFLIYDAQGKTVFVGAGVPVAGSDGKYTLTVTGSVTSALVAGTGKVEAAAVLIPVAIPAFTTLDYVVVP